MGAREPHACLCARRAWWQGGRQCTPSVVAWARALDLCGIRCSRALTSAIRHTCECVVRSLAPLPFLGASSQPVRDAWWFWLRVLHWCCAQACVWESSLRCAQFGAVLCRGPLCTDEQG